MMFSHLIILLPVLCVHHVSTSDETCVEEPVFTPSSRLVVKHGDPANATCVVCQHYCHNVSHSGLEVPQGKSVEEEENKVWTWRAEEVTEWDMLFKCYYVGYKDLQCSGALSVTVYKLPENMSISVVGLDCEQYTLQCAVVNVAPVESLTVTFYRGDTALAQRQSEQKGKKPVTEVFRVTINTTEEDVGAHYWCKAQLDLGPEGPQAPPVMQSESVSQTLYCEESEPTTPLPTTTLLPTTPPTTTTTIPTTTSVATTTPTTPPKRDTDPYSSSGSVSAHSCIVCFMLLMCRVL